MTSEIWACICRSCRKPLWFTSHAYAPGSRMTVADAVLPDGTRPTAGTVVKCVFCGSMPEAQPEQVRYV